MATAKREASYSGNDQQWDVQMEAPKSARHDFMQMDRPTQSLAVLLYDVSSSMEGSKHCAACEYAERGSPTSGRPERAGALGSP